LRPIRLVKSRPAVFAKEAWRRPVRFLQAFLLN